MENKIELKALLNIIEEDIEKDVLENNDFIFMDHTVKCIKHLPSLEKYELLMTTLAESKEKNYFNNFKIDIFFHLNLILSYCLNIEYEKEDYENPYQLYDRFKRSGFLDEFIRNFDEDEYKELFNHLEILVNTITESENSMAGIIAQIFEDIPEISESLKVALKEIKPETVTQIKDYLEAKRS